MNEVKADLRMGAFSEMVREFGELIDDEHALTREVARALGQALGAACALVRIDDRARVVDVHAWHRDAARAEPIAAIIRESAPLSETSAAAMFASRRPVLLTGDALAANLAADSSERRARKMAFGVTALAIAPLVTRTRVVGSLVLLRDEGTFDDGDLAFVQSLADHAALALHHAHTLRRVREARDESERSAEANRLLFDASPVPLIVFDFDTLGIESANDAATELFGYPREELLAMTLDAMRSVDEAVPLARVLEQPYDALWSGSARYVRKNGATIIVEGVSRPFEMGARRMRLAALQDVTTQRKLSEQVARSQRMDAIGNLAGGIAHDFNNMLSVILTTASIMRDDLRPSDPLRDEVGQILLAAERSSELTRQLLAFGRQQILEPRVVQLGQVVRGIERMLLRVVGEHIELTVLEGDRGAAVRADPGQIEQVIMNLVVNARDAMRETGRLTIETTTAYLDDAYVSEHHGVAPGAYVMLAVSDTGVGIEPQIQSRVFEPFFTTKQRGQGTGLGLATVFGIVKQSGGHIWLYSEPGRGTTFKVYLPRVDAELDEVAQTRASNVMVGGRETILLVEDEDQVRVAIRLVLRRLGYTVLEARNGGEALMTCERFDAKIHLLLTDVVMPQMSGRALAERLAKERPEMRVLFVSGYTENSIVHHGVLDAGIAFLAKPILPTALARKLREVLDAP